MTAQQTGKQVELPNWFQWATGTFGITLVSIGIWVGTIQTRQNELMKYRDDNEPLKMKMHQVQTQILEKLNAIEKDLDRIEEKQDEHIKEFTRYKDDAAKSTQEFYRRNPNL